MLVRLVATIGDQGCAVCVPCGLFRFPGTLMKAYEGGQDNILSKM